jgi:transporter family protein
MKNTHLMLLFTTLSILAWGVAGIFGKLAFHKKMLPFSVFLAQVIVYSVAGAVLVLLSTRIESISPWRSPWNIYGWLSGMAMMLGLLFFTLALHKGQATVVVPLTALYCGVSVALSYAVLGERPTPLQWLGIALALVSVALILSAPLTSAAQAK